MNKKHKNYFSYFHPVTLLLYFLLLMIIIFLCDYGAVLVYAFISFSICVIYSEGIKAYIKALIYYVMLTVVMGCFNCIFNHSGENIFLYVNDTPLTLDSLFYGIYTGLMISCLLMWFRLFNRSVDNGKINYVIGRRFPVIGLIISMCFSFTKRFKIKLNNMQQSLYTLGFKKLSIKNASVTLNALMNVMLKDSVLTADSMTARGYGSKHRRLYDRYVFSIRDIIFIIVSVALFICAVFFSQIIIPLILAPLFYNLYEEILWKYYQSKI